MFVPQELRIRNAAGGFSAAQGTVCLFTAQADTAPMITTAQTVLLLVVSVCVRPASGASESEATPEYTADAQMKLPDHYREWVYLTAGFDMSYSPNLCDGPPHVRQCLRQS